MTTDVVKYIKGCHKWQTMKAERQKPTSLLKPICICGKPFTKLTLDYLGPLPRANKEIYILVESDNTTRFALAKATKKADLQTTARFHFLKHSTLWHAGESAN